MVSAERGSACVRLAPRSIVSSYVVMETAPPGLPSLRGVRTPVSSMARHGHQSHLVHALGYPVIPLGIDHAHPFLAALLHEVYDTLAGHYLPVVGVEDKITKGGSLENQSCRNTREHIACCGA